MPTRFLHDCRRTAARTLIRASVPERVAMLLTWHTSRAICDRGHIIHKQELLETGELVAYLAQPAAPARRRPHVADTAAPRSAPSPSPRATQHRVRAHDDQRLLEQKRLRDHRLHATGATQRRGHSSQAKLG